MNNVLLIMHCVGCCMLYTLCGCGTNELELESLSNELKLLFKIAELEIQSLRVPL